MNLPAALTLAFTSLTLFGCSSVPVDTRGDAQDAKAAGAAVICTNAGFHGGPKLQEVDGKQIDDFWTRHRVLAVTIAPGKHTISASYWKVSGSTLFQSRGKETLSLEALSGHTYAIYSRTSDEFVYYRVADLGTDFDNACLSIPGLRP